MLEQIYLGLLVASLVVLAVYAHLGGSALMLGIARMVFLMFMLTGLVLMLTRKPRNDL